MLENIDQQTVDSFGQEWNRFQQSKLSGEESSFIFRQYFSIFPWELISKEAEGFDMGCGTGRWAAHVAKKVGLLHCIDPSSAIDVAKSNLRDFNNVVFYKSSADTVRIQKGSQDFGYSLGVLHHVPDHTSAIRSCVELLKPGSPFLLYLYSSFDNRPGWYKQIWRVSNIFRLAISSLPVFVKKPACDAIALFVYFPLANFARVLEKFGISVNNIPLADYRKRSFYSMRTDSYDRFSTPLEKRFSKLDIVELMEGAGLENIKFRSDSPFWVAVGTRAF